jgi:protein-S-isoprenylcysteine O-methyltransferase Ste14
MSGRVPVQALLLVALILTERACLVTFTRGRGKARTAADTASAFLWLLCFLGTLAGALARSDLVGNPAPAAVFAAGIGIVAAGILLRILALRRLGRFFSHVIVIREQHVLVRDGPYRYLRHPLHVGLVLEILGMAVLGGAWWGYALAVAAAGVALRREIREERALRDFFGDEYGDYTASTWGLTDMLPPCGRR